MTDQTTKPIAPAKTDAKDVKATAPAGKQTYTEAQLKAMGLDPAPYGYVKK